MDSVLEVQRKAHEELDRLEAAIVNELVDAPKNHQNRIARDTRVLHLIERSQKRSVQALELSEDQSGARQEEITAISGPNEFAEFYKRLKIVKEYHRRFPNDMAEPMEYEFALMQKNKEQSVAELASLFTGEEMFGKYLDLTSLHREFVNLKGNKPLAYILYLEKFDFFKGVARETKTTSEYKTYVDHLLAYIVGFIKRTQPLTDMESALSGIEEEFNEKWERNEIIGWEHSTSSSSRGNTDSLYCVACAKLFAKQTVFDGHLKGKKHEKAAQELMQKSGGKLDEGAVDAERKAAEAAAVAQDKATAVVEYKIHAIAANMLKEHRDETKNFIERKQTRTGEEMEEDKDDAEEETLQEVKHESDHEDDQDDKPIYNPLNLPLGWDGKPIPFWLYKLHGLSVSYYCEICDMTFRGRKSFERHFMEFNHSNMLKRLGIPNRSEFLEITKVEDAVALWEKLQRDKTSGVFKPEADEEFEDDRGNVFNKKTYEDLKRQGLL